MKVTTLYKFGFCYNEIPYGWKNKKLYRLPYIKNNRSYGLLEIKFYCFKSTFVANIQKNKLTINRLKAITTEINIEVSSIISNDVPF